MDDGDVVFATGEGAVSRRSCPWGPVYVAQRDLVLGNVYLRVGQRFTYETRTSGQDGFVRRVRRKPDLLPGMPDDAG